MKDSLSNLYKKMSIRSKWFIFVCILLLYPMFFIGYIGYKNYEGIIKNHFITSVQKEVTTASQQVKDQLANIEEFIAKLQQDEAIYDFTEDYFKLINKKSEKSEEYVIDKYKYIVMNDYDLAQKVKGYLRSVMFSRTDISLGAYQFTEQADTAYVISKNKVYSEEKDFISQGVLKKIKQAFKKCDDKTIYYVDSKGQIYIAQKIFDRYTFTQSGTIIFKLSDKHTLKNYKKMLEGSKEAVYVSVEGIPIGEFGNVTQKKKNKLAAFIEMNPQEGMIYSEDDNKQAIVYNLIISKNITLASAVFISTDILLQDIRTMSRFIFLLCISTLPIFVLLANKLYKEVIYPVYVLSDKMHQIEKGELGVEIKNTRKDEIGYVFTAFNRMSRQIQYLVNCVYKEQLALKNSELKALQSQINPHFLYNTLEMINWKARMSGEKDLSEMIEALSGIMEINIDRRADPFITLKEEVDYLKNYMFLIEKRFGAKIGFGIEVDEKLLHYKMPRLLLQPLIENAISHGIEPIGQGVITVLIKEEKGKILIVIRDNGQGIEKEMLSKIQEQLSELDKGYLEKEEDARGHIGVANVQKRIQLLYGDAYGIAINSTWRESTEIYIKLPLTKTGQIENE